MKNVKLLSCTLTLGLIFGLAGCGSNTATPSAETTTAVTSEAATEAPAATSEAATEVASEAPAESATAAESTAEGSSRTDDTAQAATDTTTFKDAATSLSFQYPSSWKTNSSQLPSTIPGADTTLVAGVESTDAADEIGVLGAYKLNMDLGTGDTFKTTAEAMAKTMFSKESMDNMLPSILQTFESQGMTASLMDMQTSVPMTISGNTFYRTSLKIKMELGSVSKTGSYEYVVGGANDQFFIFMGISTNETNLTAIDTAINTISFDK